MGALTYLRRFTPGAALALLLAVTNPVVSLAPPTQDLHSATVDARTTQPSVCGTLTAALGNKVSYPNSPAYINSTQSYWSQQEQLITPSCIVSPTSAQDVSTALKIILSSSAKFAVRSGGHGAIGGIANIQDGVTIDLRGLNVIKSSSDGRLVQVGPGQTWGTVYTALEGLGLTVAGGRDGPVGVGGLTLGGGFGYFATKAGFTCDNVVEYEIVLGNGSIVTANRSKNASLWKALKGGGSNFGIVTKYTFQTFAVKSVWGGDAYYPSTTVSSQLEALYAFTANPSYDVNAGLIMTFAYSPSTGALFANNYAYAEPVVNPPAFDVFTAISGQLSNDTAVMTMGQFSFKQGELSMDGYQEVAFSVTFANNLAMLQDLWEVYLASTAAVSGAAGIQWSLSLEPIVPAIADQTRAKGGNLLGLDKVPSQGLILSELTASFESADDHATVNAAAESLLADIIRVAHANGAYHPYVDMNHAAAGQNPIASYGSKNEKFLQATAIKYDPQGVFQRLMPGGFKV